MPAGARSYSLSVPSSGVLDTIARRTPARARIDSARSGVYASQSGWLKWMCASKIGYSARALAGSHSVVSSAMAASPSVMRRILAERRTGADQLPLTDFARTVAHAPRVGHGREDHAIFLFDPLLVRAASAADDPRRRRTHQRRSVPLELQQRRLHRSPEGVVAPASIATDDSMTRNQDRDRI